MNMRTSSYVSAALLVAGVALLSGCVSAESRWQEVQQRNTVYAYESFVREYPEAPYAATARERIDQLTFEKAKRAGTEQAYQSYLKDLPNGRSAGEARQAIPKLAFETAARANTVESYEKFLARFPDHESAARATERARALRFDAAKNAESVSAIEDFLKRYPQGSDSEQLKLALPAVREWEPRKQLGELIIRLCPEVTTSFMEGLKRTPSKTYKEDLATIRSLLERGVDANAVRIEGFVAPVEESSSDTSGGVVRMSFKYSAGSRGQAVPANKGGMTLLDYCKANSLTDAYELLKSHGAK